MLLLLKVVLKAGFVDKRFLVVLDAVVEEVVVETFEAVVTVDGGSKQRKEKINSTRIQLCKVAATLAYYRGKFCVHQTYLIDKPIIDSNRYQSSISIHFRYRSIEIH